MKQRNIIAGLALSIAGTGLTSCSNMWGRETQPANTVDLDTLAT